MKIEMINKITNIIRWSVYYPLDIVSRMWNIFMGIFGYNTQTDLGLSWLVWLESRRVEREIQVRETQRLKQQKEADEKMRLAKEDLDGQNIQNQQ